MYSYATAGPGIPFWGSALREYPKPEGDLFPGLVPLVLAAIGLAVWRGTPSTTGRPPRFAANRPWLAPALSALATLHVFVALITLLQRRINTSVAGLDIQITDINQLLLRALLLAALSLWLSPATRGRVRSFLLGRGFFVVVLVAAVWLSFGVAVEVRGRGAELVAPYAWLFEHAPGFQGVRVPARFAMIVTLMLAVLGGYGAAAVAAWARGPFIVAAVSFAFLAESVVVPMPLNGTRSMDGYRTPEARIYRPARAPAIYRHVSALPHDAVLVELPLGTIEYDVRAVYYSTAHWRRLVNGYSGFVPPSYEKLVVTLSNVPRFPALALATLREHRATHAIVHEGAYLEADSRTSQALIAAGAREIAREGTDVLLQLP